ncbi:hypothetical protein F2Q68_00003342 [Brassica cretica]|uniref:Uncharacterized protein n=1 Tax=Brassica cretica TaxID=69181 RepID=A0A8S9J9P4_BRACR|nr:hypothetical protein F2Q68_00003342 [Brassica cretica]
MANRRVSSRTRKIATKMAAALTSTDNRTQADIARLEALENDNGALEVVDLNDDEEASLDEEDDLELISSLKLANVINILELSLIPFDEALNDAATMFVLRNLLAICDTVEFRLFVGKNPDLTVDIMKSSKSRRWKNYYI